MHFPWRLMGMRGGHPSICDQKLLSSRAYGGVPDARQTHCGNPTDERQPTATTRGDQVAARNSRSPSEPRGSRS